MVKINVINVYYGITVHYIYIYTLVRHNAEHYVLRYKQITRTQWKTIFTVIKRQTLNISPNFHWLKLKRIIWFITNLRYNYVDFQFIYLIWKIETWAFKPKQFWYNCFNVCGLSHTKTNDVKVNYKFNWKRAANRTNRKWNTCAVGSRVVKQ